MWKLLRSDTVSLLPVQLRAQSSILAVLPNWKLPGMEKALGSRNRFVAGLKSLGSDCKCTGCPATALALLPGYPNGPRLFGTVTLSGDPSLYLRKAESSHPPAKRPPTLLLFRKRFPRPNGSS